MNKGKKFREMLNSNQPALVCGVYDGLSAHLAEKAGFQALWASGYCISASHRLPDVGLLTMTEHLNAAREMDRVSNLPVIADVDDGFGDAINVVRMIQEYEAAGIAAVSMEDNQHPKRSSLYGNQMNRQLVDAEEFTLKIRAAKEAQRTEDFMLIARTEALVADMGVPEALRRAHLYAEAGADLILVHSKDKTPDSIYEFSKAWNRNIPLVAVPTAYPNVKANELFRAGYKVVIFANQGLRASVKAMDDVFTKLIKTQTPGAVENEIATLKEIAAAVGLEEVQRIESTYIPSLQVVPKKKSA